MTIRNTITILLALLLMVSCKDNSSKDGFTVTGTVENNTAKMIYLEEVPATSMRPILVDSAELGKDGKFSLEANPIESVVFNLRLDRNMYPIASVINDVPKINMNIKLNKQNQQFAESYEVTGSPVSQEMKDYMITVNNDLQKIFLNSGKLDTLQKAGAPDSVLFSLMATQEATAEGIKKYSQETLAKANNPALLLFELGYYQSTANSTGFGLEPLSNEEVTTFISDMARKFPAHQAIAAVSASLQQEQQQSIAASWVGKQAPDFSLPDVSGKEVKLSSFRGKYVLVDFWASWCKPCRDENPNVVNAYNQFKGRNFTILGVSLDRPGQKDKWIQAIKDDKLDWTHVSDLKFWDSSVIPLYGFDGIPFNVLVDPSGTVIAEGLRGQGLEDKLTEVLN